MPSTQSAYGLRGWAKRTWPFGKSLPWLIYLTITHRQFRVGFLIIIYAFGFLNSPKLGYMKQICLGPFNIGGLSGSPFVPTNFDCTVSTPLFQHHQYLPHSSHFSITIWRLQLCWDKFFPCLFPVSLPFSINYFSDHGLSKIHIGKLRWQTTQFFVWFCNSRVTFP